MAKHDGDSPSGFLAIPVLMLFMGGALWYLYGSSAIAISFKLSAAPFGLFATLPSFLFPNGVSDEFLLVSRDMRASSAVNYGWETFQQILALWGYVLRLLIVPALLVTSFVNWRLPVNFYYRRSLNLRELAEQNSEMFPCTKPSIGKDLHKTNPYEGPWRVADDYIDFASFNGLLLYKGQPIPETSVKNRGLSLKKKRKLFPHYSYVTLDTKKTDKLLTNQLGKPWRGVGSLDPLHRALLTALMALTAGGEFRQRGRDLLDQVSRTFVEGDPKTKRRPAAETTGMAELLAEVEHNEEVREVVNQHGYESTVFIALLISAREKAGKVPPSMFLWLRPTDRTLWYSLHAIGGRKPWVEGSAAWSHFFAEKELEKSIGTPVIQGATDALDAELYSEKWSYSPTMADAEAIELAEEKRLLREAEQSKGFKGGGRR